MSRISRSVIAAAVLAIVASCNGTGGTSATGTGGKTGSGGQAGGHAGGGGVGGGGGSMSTGGGGGGAGQGFAGGGGFDCTGVSLGADCSTYPVGLVCQLLGGEAAMFCVCTPENGGPKWQCNGSTPCPYAAGNSGGCSLSTLATIANLGGCKYPPATVCSCEASDGGAAWSCNDATCPATPPTGSCLGSAVAGVSCSYAGSSISCECGSTGTGGSRWLCNGKATPDCPTSWPGSGVDCSSFQPDTVCPFPAGNVTGGPCTCVGNGTSLTWHCANG
jgi:hypothetical protein